MTIHSEAKQQGRIHSWCYEKGIRFAALLNSTYTASWRAINQNKLLGVSRGLPDLLCIIPGKYRRDGESMLLFIELKTETGKPSKEQLSWIEDLQACHGVNAAICYGYQDAVDYIGSYMEVAPPPDTRVPTHQDILNI